MSTHASRQNLHLHPTRLTCSLSQHAMQRAINQAAAKPPSYAQASPQQRRCRVGARQRMRGIGAGIKKRGFGTQFVPREFYLFSIWVRLSCGGACPDVEANSFLPSLFFGGFSSLAAAMATPTQLDGRQRDSPCPRNLPTPSKVGLRTHAN